MLFSGLALKTVLLCGGAVAIASCGAYGIHTLKAAGANELAAKVSQATLQQQQAEIERQKADVVRLTGRNAKLRTDAENRAQALSEALAGVPSGEATAPCPANCLLPSS